MKKIILLLKNEMILMSLWLIMSLLKAKWSSENQIYIITLRCSSLWAEYLANITHNRWFGVPTILSPFSNIKLGIVYIKNQDSS